MGINLFGANHVVIFDASWNPAEDSQAIFRVYRFGQQLPVHVYRLVAHQLMEGKIYNKQVVKTALSMHVVEDQHAKQHFSQAQTTVSIEADEEGSQLALSQGGAEAAAAGEATREAEDDKKNPRGAILKATLEAIRPTIKIRVHAHDSLIEDDASEHISDSEKKLAMQLEDKEIVMICRWCSDRYTQYRNTAVRHPLRVLSFFFSLSLRHWAVLRGAPVSTPPPRYRFTRSPRLSLPSLLSYQPIGVSPPPPTFSPPLSLSFYQPLDVSTGQLDVLLRRENVRAARSAPVGG
jgi:hypothetical protein